MAPGLQQAGNEAAPTGLVRGPRPAPGVAVKILVKENVVLEMRVGGQLGMVFQNRALAVSALHKQLRQAPPEFARYFQDGHVFAGAGGTFNFEIVAVIIMEFLQGFDEQVVHWHPNGAAPI